MYRSTIIQYFNNHTKHWYRYHLIEERILETKKTKWVGIPVSNNDDD
jgi:hypothetical protein